jgi:dihydrofolate reductase
MRKVIVWNMMTLDGYFEGTKPWDIDFHEYGWGPELERFSLEQTKEVGTPLFGRRTYDGMAAHWSTATAKTADFMNSVPKVVFSNTLETATWSNTRLVKGRAEDEVVRLKHAQGKDLFIFGSAELADSLTKQGLIDEYRIGLNPLLLGRGSPLFKSYEDLMRLKLLVARPLQSGVVLLRYARA